MAHPDRSIDTEMAAPRNTRRIIFDRSFMHQTRLVTVAKSPASISPPRERPCDRESGPLIRSRAGYCRCARELSVRYLDERTAIYHKAPSEPLIGLYIFVIGIRLNQRRSLCSSAVLATTPPRQSTSTAVEIRSLASDDMAAPRYPCRMHQGLGSLAAPPHAGPGSCG